METDAGEACVVKRIRSFWTVFLMVGVLAGPATAADMRVPLDLQVKLFLKALTFDRNLEKRTDARLTVGIVYFPDTPQSEREARHFHEALEAFRGKKAGGLPVASMLFAYAGSEALKAVLADNTISALYIAAGSSTQVQQTAVAALEQQVITLAAETTYAVDHNVSMVVAYRINRPLIFLNLASARAAGADFNAKFLRVAHILDTNRD